jgi:hypothetical protein
MLETSTLYSEIMWIAFYVKPYFCLIWITRYFFLQKSTGSPKGLKKQYVLF